MAPRSSGSVGESDAGGDDDLVAGGLEGDGEAVPVMRNTEARE
jgi:hypothetical protein